MAKPTPDLVINRLGTHLFQVTRKDGSNFLKWDWNKLLEEVQAATSVKVTIEDAVIKGTKKLGIDAEAEVRAALEKEGLLADIKVTKSKKSTAERQVQHIDVGDLSPKEATALIKKVTKAVTAKKDMVKETEAKVAKTRAKKADEKINPSVGKTAKKAPAKNPAAKKSTK